MKRLLQALSRKHHKGDLVQTLFSGIVEVNEIIIHEGVRYSFSVYNLGELKFTTSLGASKKLRGKTFKKELKKIMQSWKLKIFPSSEL